MGKVLKQVEFSFRTHLMDFKFEAGTSRGVLKQKVTYFIKASEKAENEVVGWGEAAPLPKLSVDDVPDFEDQLLSICSKLSGNDIQIDKEGFGKWIKRNISATLPSIRFAFETALLDLFHGGNGKIFNTDFFNKEKTIPINGLIWMGSKSFMMEQIDQKLKEGYDCIKMKIGAIDFDRECELLAYIRSTYYKKDITLRVDANGAFSPTEALVKLEQLSQFDLHSIEQPIRQGQWIEMAALCRDSQLPIALDEELIGIESRDEKIKLLKTIKPQFIIIKPTLVGGLESSKEWIFLAEELKIGWWITSALESNIGLNAIAQFTDTYPIGLPQGLGTGQLYTNNIKSPLYINKGRLGYDKKVNWERP